MAITTPGINPYCMTQREIDMFSKALDEYNDQYWKNEARSSRENEQRGFFARLL